METKIMTHINEYLGHHPYIGLCISLFHLLTGVVLGITHSPELPTIVMQLFQIGAWSAGIAAGIFTCYGVYRTHHGKKKKKF